MQVVATVKFKLVHTRTQDSYWLEETQLTQINHNPRPWRKLTVCSCSKETGTVQLRYNALGYSKTSLAS